MKEDIKSLINKINKTEDNLCKKRNLLDESNRSISKLQVK